MLLSRESPVIEFLQDEMITTSRSCDFRSRERAILEKLVDWQQATESIGDESSQQEGATYRR